MEQFQLAYVSAVAAAAGCVVVGKPSIDEGVDLEIRHKCAQHQRDGVARLEIQMKATSSPANKDGSLSVQVSKDRFMYFASSNPTVDKIVVVLSLPGHQENWLSSTPDALFLRHCAYWVNLAGRDEPLASEPTISAPPSQVFDDVQLCEIMTRVGQGGSP